MDIQALKKFLAGLCMASLVSASGLALTGCNKAGPPSS
ncbi:MAG: SbtA family thio(seleno)oxazole RiPP natural product precursor [Desulfomonilia bacterium]